MQISKNNNYKDSEHSLATIAQHYGQIVGGSNPAALQVDKYNSCREVMKNMFDEKPKF